MFAQPGKLSMKRKVVNGMCSVCSVCTPGEGDDNPAQASSVRKIEHALHRTKLLKVDPDGMANGFTADFCNKNT